MSQTITSDNAAPTWIKGELRLADMLDSRMIGLLRAIDQSGSINQAAKQVGLSYKGAWQIIERANNGAPKTLVSTATGGSKGGGTCLTEAGRSLLALFTRLEQQHQQFLDQLNRSLADDPDTVLLLQRLVVKTSARNQIFGSITAIQAGAVNAEVIVKLKGGEQVITSVTLTSLRDLGLQVGADAVLLINSADITLTIDSDPNRFTARNRLSCSVIRVQQDEVNAEVIVLLPGGETLVAMITQQSAQSLALMPGMAVWAIFKSNVPVVGVMPIL
ncbi:MAG: TOBE domain-containing protein [Methylobacter sp.]|uniref:TOBE domain-containing protein n=1 Tax=Methylobacter sp. TaxID=2051955 RepID=UPI00273141C3|nr:TOBE domain-containing protein [Methylobacter sp.]MDP1664762.1 TOBE domain-containing protein [Methylobacter sp.]